jgi:hypothetical protein
MIAAKYWRTTEPAMARTHLSVGWHGLSSLAEQCQIDRDPVRFKAPNVVQD